MQTPEQRQVFLAVSGLIKDIPVMSGEGVSQWQASIPTLKILMEANQDDFPFQYVWEKLEDFFKENQSINSGSETQDLRAFRLDLNNKVTSHFKRAEAEGFYQALQEHATVQDWALWLSSEQSRRQVYDQYAIKAVTQALSEFMASPAATPRGPFEDELKEYVKQCAESLSQDNNSYPDISRRSFNRILELSRG